MAFGPLNTYDHECPGRSRYVGTTTVSLKQQLRHLRYWAVNHPSEHAREILVERANEMAIEITRRENRPSRPRYVGTTTDSLKQQLKHLRYWAVNHPSEDTRETLVERANEMVIEITWREDNFFYFHGPENLDLQPR